MGAYALIAAGFLNWDYQRAVPHIAIHSLAIIVPGLILFLFTLWGPTSKLLKKRAIQIIWLAISLAALAYAFLN